MTDRLAKSAVEVLTERVSVLEQQLDLLRTGPVPEIEDSKRPNWLVREWRRIFGRRVYDGPKTCGHCKYCTWFFPYHGQWYRKSPSATASYDKKPGCGLLRHDFLRDLTAPACSRFTPSKKWMRVVYK